MNRLDEIKKRQARPRHTEYDWARFSANATYDIVWLIAEVERLREIERGAKEMLYGDWDEAMHHLSRLLPEGEEA